MRQLYLLRLRLVFVNLLEDYERLSNPPKKD
jgi:hypothetical protein